MSVSRHGLSVVELLVVIAIAAILMGVGFVRLNSSGVATAQAARVVAAAVNQARFEAIRTNGDAWLRVVADVGGDGGLIAVCGADAAATGATCGVGAQDVNVTQFANSDLARARIASPADVQIRFDRRGVMRTPAVIDVVVTDRSGGNGRTVRVLPTGRAEIQ